MDDESQVTSSTQESVEKSMDKPENRALDLLALGRKQMICCDYFGASMILDEACKLLAEEHGQVDEALGEPYHLYGRSLLELAREENSVLGSRVPVPTEESESSEEGEEEEVKEGVQGEVEEGEQKEPQNKSGAGMGERVEEPSSSCGDTNLAQAGGEGEPALIEASDVSEAQPKTDKNQDDEGEDPSTLQLAWEVLEVARVIYERQETNEGRLQLAEVCMTLGEVSLESDQYQRAIEDFATCLQLREAVLSPSDRLLADAHYHLGLAFSLCGVMDEALKEYIKSRGVLELRKETLMNELEGEKDQEEQERLREEIIDLDQVLPDITAKVTDTEDSIRAELAKKQSDELLEKVSPPKNTISGAGSSTPVNDISCLVRRKPADTSGGMSTTEDKPAADISHLVHRKRPAEESSITNGNQPSKRPHADDDSEEVVSSVQDD